MAIQVDIGTKVYGSDDTVYRLFPGKHYRHFDTMKENSVVYLDYPGVGLPGPNGYLNTHEQLVRLVRAENRKEVIGGRNPNLLEELYFVDEEELGVIHWSQRRRLSLEWLNLLYHDMQLGDFIVLPGPGYVKADYGEWLGGNSLVGEIAGPSFVLDAGVSRDIQLGRYVARKINWFGEVDEAELPRHVRTNLRTRNPLIALRAEPLAHIIGAGHHNLIMGDEFHARFVTAKRDFSALDSFHFAAFALAVVAVCQRMENGGDPLGPDESIYTLAASVAQGDQLVPVQEMSIRSPGHTTLRGIRYVPAVIAILFQLAVTVPAEELFADPGPAQVTVVNTKSSDFDPCDVGIDETVRGSIDIMGYDLWQEACYAALSSRENDGLNSPATRVTTESEAGD